MEDSGCENATMYRCRNNFGIGWGRKFEKELKCMVNGPTSLYIDTTCYSYCIRNHVFPRTDWTIHGHGSWINNIANITYSLRNHMLPKCIMSIWTSSLIDVMDTSLNIGIFCFKYELSSIELWTKLKLPPNNNNNNLPNFTASNGSTLVRVLEMNLKLLWGSNLWSCLIWSKAKFIIFWSLSTAFSRITPVQVKTKREGREKKNNVKIKSYILIQFHLKINKHNFLSKTLLSYFIHYVRYCFVHWNWLFSYSWLLACGIVLCSVCKFKWQNACWVKKKKKKLKSSYVKWLS